MPTIRLTKLLTSIVLGLGVGVNYIPSAIAAPYGYVNLGSLGGTLTAAQDLNDRGQVVGYSLTADNIERAFITGSNGSNMVDLGTLGGTSSRAYGVNASGRVVGISDISGNSSRYAFITSPGGKDMTNLGDLGGGRSGAYSINASGQVVGWSYDSSHMFQPAFVTGADGKNMRYAVGSPFALDFNEARDINDAGQIIGGSSMGFSRGFLSGPPDYYPSTDLGTLDTTGQFPSSFAYGINAEGRGVGWADTAEGGSHAFITGPDGIGMFDLGTLGGERSAGYGINGEGQVVGFSQVDDGSSHAFITDPQGFGMTDLNSLVDLPRGVILYEALAINGLSQVIANASNGDAYLLSPIPEPETYALMLAGLVLTGVMVRRKQKVDALKGV